MSDERYVSVSEAPASDAVIVDKQSSSPTPDPITSDYSYGRNQEPLETNAVRGLSSAVYGYGVDTSTQSVNATSTADATISSFTVSGMTAGTNTLTATEAGLYLISAGCRWSSGATGDLRTCSILVNGSFVTPLQDARALLSGNDTYLVVQGAVNLAVGDVVKMQIYNGSSSSQNCTARRFSVAKL